MSRAPFSAARVARAALTGLGSSCVQGPSEGAQCQVDSGCFGFCLQKYQGAMATTRTKLAQAAGATFKVTVTQCVWPSWVAGLSLGVPMEDMRKGVPA